MAIIYSITNTQTNQIYIGSTVNEKHRRNSHFSMLAKGKHDNIFLQHSYDKYGKDVFVFNVIETVENDVVSILTAEQKYLDLHFDNGKMCYNLQPIANSSLGRKMHPETRVRMEKYWAEHTGSNHPHFGTKRNPEVGKKISLALKGKVTSAETKQKQSLAKLGKTGQKRTETTKKLLSVGKIGDKNPMYGKCGSQHHNSIAIIQMDLEGNELNRFDSLLQAEEGTGVSFKTISLCINNKQKTSGGYKWKKQNS